MARFFTHAPVKGVPPSTGSALTPTMTRTYAGWSSRGKVFGQPGTMGVPIKDPGAMHRGINDLANVGTFNSASAPDVIFPSLYWEADSPEDKERAPVSRISDDQMPVPAGRPINFYTKDPFKARRGGQSQVVQPQVVQRWPAWRGGNS